MPAHMNADLLRERHRRERLPIYRLVAQRYPELVMQSTGQGSCCYDRVAQRRICQLF